ncbi:MAG: c-type cytochrome [Terriglobia bacterium]
MRLRIIPALLVVIASLALGSASFAAASEGAAQLFKSHCSMCHGPQGKGYKAIHTPDFTSAAWQAKTSNKKIVHAITYGVEGTAMPSFKSKLKAAQIQDLLHYIRSLGQK